MTKSDADGVPFGLEKLTDEERALDFLEKSWADFSYRLRTGYLLRRHNYIGFRPVHEVVGYRSLTDLHALFEVHREQVEKGHRQHVFFAMQLAASEGVPMPYWLTVKIERMAAVLDEPERWTGDAPPNLHDLFGLSDIYPASPDARKLAFNYRIKWKRSVQLWHDVRRLVEENKLSRTEATRRAAKNLGMSKRTADDMLKAVEDQLALNPFQASRRRKI